jgi:dienelactone hydrolase
MGTTLWDYYVRTAEKLTQRSLEGINTLDDWGREREKRLTQFYTTMGVYPLPERCDLNPRLAGEFAGEGYRAQKVSFEILRDVHATANIYRPDPLPAGQLPGVVYVCGHYLIGVHGFQEHGMMWARRGYVCLILDSIEQHDNRGDHHALSLGKRSDWVSRGYSAAGGELWNSMRALDLLLSLPEVDPQRVGTTGLSGGGAQSFFLAVADERARAVASACGVGVLQPLMAQRQWLRFCDCMFPHNMLQQDSAEWAALIAPRPLLLCFAREDDIFSPDAYRLLVEKVSRIYALYGAPEKCKLLEVPGAHGYTPDMIAEINRWFDAYVAGADHPVVGLPAQVHDEPTTTVFNGAVPETDHLDLLPELLSRRGSVPLPESRQEWARTRQKMKSKLLAGPLSWLDRSDEQLTAERLGSYLTYGEQERRYLLYRGEIAGVEVWLEMNLPAEMTGKVMLGLAAPGESIPELQRRLLPLCGDHALVTVEPRGAGLTGFDHGSASLRPHLLRAGAYIGLTDTLLGIHDVFRALGFLRSVPELAGQQFCLYGRGAAGVACLYAAILDDEAAGVVADTIPISHVEGAHIIGILQTLDIPQAIGLVAPRPVGIPSFGAVRSLWADRAYRRLGCPDHLMWGGSLQHAVKQVLTLGPG